MADVLKKIKTQETSPTGGTRHTCAYGFTWRVGGGSCTHDVGADVRWFRREPILRLRLEKPRSIQREPGREKAITFLLNVVDSLMARTTRTSLTRALKAHNPIEKLWQRRRLDHAEYRTDDNVVQADDQADD